MANRGARVDVLARIARGVLLAMLVTLLLMAALAGIVVLAGLPDSAITACNQLIKGLALLLGALAAVGRGGTRGFALGAATGLIYMALSYGLYALLGAGMLPALALTTELFMGALIGALSGALAANLPAARPRVKKRGALSA